MKDKSILIIAAVVVVGALALITGFKRVSAPPGWNVTFAADRADAAAGEPASRQHVDAGGAQRATVTLRQMAGELSLRPGTGFFDATFHTQPASWIPTTTYSVEGSAGALDVEQSEHAPFAVGGTDNRWDVRVGRDLPTALVVKQGVGTARLEVGHLKLTSLEFVGGAGETKIDMTGFAPPGADVPVTLDRGVGSTTLVVPSEVPVVVRVHQGVGATHANGFARQSGGDWTNDAYRPGVPAVVVTVTQGPGDVTLESK